MPNHDFIFTLAQHTFRVEFWQMLLLCLKKTCEHMVLTPCFYAPLLCLHLHPHIGSVRAAARGRLRRAHLCESRARRRAAVGRAGRHVAVRREKT